MIIVLMASSHLCKSQVSKLQQDSLNWESDSILNNHIMNTLIKDSSKYIGRTVQMALGKVYSPVNWISFNTNPVIPITGTMQSYGHGTGYMDYIMFFFGKKAAIGFEIDFDPPIKVNIDLIKKQGFHTWGPYLKSVFNTAIIKRITPLQ